MQAVQETQRQILSEELAKAIKKLSWVPGFTKYVNGTGSMLRGPEDAVMAEYLENRYGSVERAVAHLRKKAEEKLPGLLDYKHSPRWYIDNLHSGNPSVRVRTAFLLSVLLDTPVLKEIASVSQRLAGAWKGKIADILVLGYLNATDWERLPEHVALDRVLADLRNTYYSYKALGRFMDGDPSSALLILDAYANEEVWLSSQYFDLYTHPPPELFARVKAQWDALARATRGAFSYRIEFDKEAGIYRIVLKGAKEHTITIGAKRILDEIRQHKGEHVPGMETFSHVLSRAVDDIDDTKPRDLIMVYSVPQGSRTPVLVVGEVVGDGVAYYTRLGTGIIRRDELGKAVRLGPQFTAKFRDFAGLPRVPSIELYDTIRGNEVVLSGIDADYSLGVYETYDGRLKVAVGYGNEYRVYDAAKAGDVLLELATRLSPEQVTAAANVLKGMGVGIDPAIEKLAIFVSKTRDFIVGRLRYDTGSGWFTDGMRTVILAPGSRAKELLRDAELVKPKAALVDLGNAYIIDLDDYNLSKRPPFGLIVLGDGKSATYPGDVANIIKLLEEFKEFGKPEMYIVRTKNELAGPLVVRAGGLMLIALPLQEPYIQ